MYGALLAAFVHQLVMSGKQRHHLHMLPQRLALPRPSLMPVSASSRVWINGLRHSANSCILRGHPCITELWIGNKLDRKTFICTSDDALMYIPMTRSNNGFPSPCIRKTSSRYSCNILSKAALKLIDTTHRGFCFEHRVTLDATVLIGIDYIW